MRGVLSPILKSTIMVYLDVLEGSSSFFLCLVLSFLSKWCYLNLKILSVKLLDSQDLKSFFIKMVIDPYSARTDFRCQKLTSIFCYQKCCSNKSGVAQTQYLRRCILYQIKGENLRNMNIGYVIARNLENIGELTFYGTWWDIWKW